MRHTLLGSMFLAMALSLVSMLPASALVIDLTYVGPGQRFGNSGTQLGHSAPNRRDGGGNLQDIMRAAADVWERVLPEPFRIDIEYGWQPLTGNTIGQHTGRSLSFSGGIIRNEASWIAFDAGYGDWYFDPQPQDSSEYAGFRQSNGNYGGVSVNDERRYTQPRHSAARGLDLFTVALHEIGHAIGWTHANLADFRRDTGIDGDGAIRIASHLPGAGALVATHGTHPEGADTLLMAHMLHSGQRLLPSVLDIASLATISRYREVRTGLDALRGDVVDLGNQIEVVLGDGTITRINLGRVFDLPEPGAMGAGLLAAAGLLRRRTR